MKLGWTVGATLAVLLFSTHVSAEEAAPPRRSVPLLATGATGLSAGLTTLAVSGIIAATQPCVTFPGIPSGCDPRFDNTYAAPLILVGGIVTVLSLPLFSIGLERDTGPLKMSRLEVGAGVARLTWRFE